MARDNAHQKLNEASEITFSVKGRKTGKEIPRPVWFVCEDNTLYLLPVQGSSTNWYKNFLADPMLKISLGGMDMPATRGKQITDASGVETVVRKFRSKYGEGDVKKYYSKFDVAVQVPL